MAKNTATEGVLIEKGIDDVEIGDVIKVNRGVYDHYGIYVKQGRHVIHYTGATGPADFNGMVRETSLDEFLNDAKSFIVCRFPRSLENLDQLTYLLTTNSFLKDKEESASNAGRVSLWDAWQRFKKSKVKDYNLYSGDETVARARNELGKTGYGIVWNNCEHFAIWCKTGLRESSQVNKIFDAIVGTIAFGGDYWI